MTVQQSSIEFDEHIPGAAEFVEQHAGEDDATVAAALATYMENSGLARSGARGVIGDTYRAIVDRVRGRRLVEDFGEHEFSVEWLGFHVPPGAKAQLNISSSRMLGYGVKLELGGFGLGSTSRQTFTINEDFRERTQCLTLSRRINARLRSFAARGKTNATEIQVDVLGVIAEERSVHEPGVDCWNDDDLEQVEPALDLRSDPVGQLFETGIKLEGDSELTIALPFSVAGLGLTPALSMKRSTQLECKLKYEFAGGFCYTPLQRTDGWGSLPIWRRS